MKAIPLYFKIVFVFLILHSCTDNSNEESNNDIIIGKWRAIEQYDENALADLPICDAHLFKEFKTDKSIISGKIRTADFPQECETLEIETGWNWSNLGNNYYRIRYLEEQGAVFTYYKNEENLVEEHPDGITKIIYEPY